VFRQKVQMLNRIMTNLDSRIIRQKCKAYLQKVQKLTRITLAGETSGHVNAGSVPAHAVHDGALVDVDAPHVVFVQSVALNKNKFSDSINSCEIVSIFS
jgi:hypothetical protein